MKKILALCFTLLLSFNFFSQSKNPISWVTSYKSISSTEGEIIIIASIEKGWHMYSQDTTSAGPVPTTFYFEKATGFKLVGKALEIGAHEIFDKAFDAKISSFSDKAEFRQKIKITGKTSFTIPFKVEYMCCDDSMCLPPKTVDLSVKVQ
ncbi:protein-disulfide reductase DsbD domain-containing protein [Aurantibacillus circumpalustris]|uniref:protein-disulfide reductase DsbD domain-containing protein n=1 Tax=Aurantibacillus circumpalustris TaxID=3036359 RepID=UPI00295B5758|nr:protein-disulfide reductase DsbD domain-containing protein [Aurantibacillus circumpalustris]